MLLAAGAILAARASLAADAASASGAPPPRPEVKIVELSYPGPFAFYKDNSPNKKDPVLVVAHAPIRLQPGVAAADLNVVVVYSLFGGQDLGAAGRIITAGLIDQNGAQFVRLSGPLEALSKVRRYGTYQFVVEVRKSKDPQVQTLNLPVQYPQTKLVTPAKLLFNLRTTLWSDPKPLNGCTFPLRLSEGLGAEDVVVEADRLPSGTLKFSHQPRLDPQNVNLVQVNADSLPMGESTANLTISSPDIEAVTLPITVNLRETPLSIVWIAFSGIMVGVLVRVVADRVIDVQQLKIQWNRLLRDIEEQRIKMLDQDSQSGLNDLEHTASRQLEQLGIVCEKATYDSSKDELPKAQAALEKLVNAFLTKQSEVRLRLADFEKLTSVSLELPEPLLASLRSHAKQLDAIRPKIDQGKLGEATVELNRFGYSVFIEFWDLLIEWHHALDSNLSEWLSIRPALPKDAQVALTTSMSAFEAKFDELKQPQDIASARSLIDAASTVAQLARQGIERTLKTAVVEAEAVAETLRHAIDGDAAWLQSLADAVLTAKLLPVKDLVSDPKGALMPATETVRQLVCRITDALREFTKGLPTPGTADQKAIWEQLEKACAEASYEKAASLAARLKGPAAQLDQMAGDFDLLERGEMQRPLAFLQPEFRNVLYEIGPIRESRIDWNIPVSPILYRLTPEAEIRHSEGTIFAVNTLRFVVVTVLLCGLAYALFEKTFVGTVGDLFAVFLWGFTLDVGVNTLVEKAGTLVASAKR
jgi:hypothetical protein